MLFGSGKIHKVLSETRDEIAKLENATSKLLSANSDDKRLRFLLDGVMSLTGATKGFLIPYDDEVDESIVSIGISDDEMTPLLKLIMKADISGEVEVGKDKWLCYPLTYGTTRVGTVVVNSTSARPTSHIIQIYLRIGGLILSFSRLKDISLKDSLTGLHTRVFFEEQLFSSIRRARRVGVPFGVIMIDIDNFKQVNSNFGHPIGDEVLRRVACELRGSVKDVDNVGRLGGEEFGIIVDDADEEVTEAVAVRLCSEVAGLDMVPLIKRNITISCGVTVWRKGMLAKDLMCRVDNALRQAKKEGKNRAVVYKVGQKQEAGV
mgnify:CR=1 FL=1